MMQPAAKMTFEATMHLSEAEVRVIQHLSSYESGLTKAIQEHVTKNFDAGVLTALLRRWRDETAVCTNRFDAARKAFRDVE